MFRKLRIDILEALLGSKRDFTTEPLGKAVLMLAIPMVLEMVMESIFVLVDIFFIGKLGDDAVSVVGITESMMSIVYAIGVGLSAGTVAIVSRRIGEKNPEAAAVATVHAIITGVFASLLIMIPGIFYSSQLLRLMGATDNMVELGQGYTSVMMVSNGVIILIFIMNAVLRSSGDAARSMRVLWLSNLVNIILDPCLIFGLGPFPELGVKGAAIATTIGRGIGVLYQFYLLSGKNGRVVIRFRHLKIEIVQMISIVKLSLGGMAQTLIATTSWIGLMRIVAVFGSEVIAGYVIAIRILIFVLLPGWGISNAAATLVGQNLGAGKPERAEKAAMIVSFLNLGLTAFLLFFVVVFSPKIFTIFTTDGAVIGYGVQCVRIFSFGFLAYSFGMVINQSFNGAGDTTTPVLINFFCFWILEVPIAYLLALSLKMEQDGVYFSVVIAETALAIIALILFKRGKWKLKKV